MQQSKRRYIRGNNEKSYRKLITEKLFRFQDLSHDFFFLFNVKKKIENDLL